MTVTTKGIIYICTDNSSLVTKIFFIRFILPGQFLNPGLNLLLIKPKLLDIKTIATEMIEIVASNWFNQHSDFHESL